jgi:hypothetical protein
MRRFDSCFAGNKKAGKRKMKYPENSNKWLG